MTSIENIEEDDYIDGPEQEFTGQTGPQVEGEPSKIGATIVRVRASENSALTRTNNPLNDNNWTVWRKQITLMLEMCGVDEYVQRVGQSSESQC